MSGTGGEVDLLIAADDGNGPTIEIVRWNHNTLSHLRTLFVWGVFDGATVTFQISPNEINWFDVANADAIAADTAVNVEFRAPFCRCVVAGSVTAAAINAKLL